MKVFEKGRCVRSLFHTVLQMNSFCHDSEVLVSVHGIVIIHPLQLTRFFTSHLFLLLLTATSRIVSQRSFILVCH